MFRHQRDASEPRGGNCAPGMNSHLPSYWLPRATLGDSRRRELEGIFGPRGTSKGPGHQMLWNALQHANVGMIFRLETAPRFCARTAREAARLASRRVSDLLLQIPTAPTDWFDPKRLSDEYVPTGFKGYGMQTRAVRGHEFGLKLSADDKRALIAFLRTL
jgi:hypothetical protein